MRNGPATLIFSVLCLCAAPCGARRQHDEPNVVVVALDGVRWQEVLEGTDPALGGDRRALFAALRGGLGGRVLAVPDARVANGTFKSLPAYLSLLSGRWSDCASNACGRAAVETLPERLARTGLPSAVIASWAPIERAAARSPGAVFVNAGLQPLDDGTGDAVFAAINAAQAADPPPWGAARRDRYTMAHALRYLRTHRPRFLFVALNDADEWAHQGDYGRYVDALESFDRWLGELAATIDALDAGGGRTLLVVTTDHGRGRGAAWRDHGGDPDAGRVWMYLRLAGGAPPDHALGRITHADLRPTVEALFGLDPVRCPTCGRPLAAVLAWARLPDARRVAGAPGGAHAP